MDWNSWDQREQKLGKTWCHLTLRMEWALPLTGGICVIEKPRWNTYMYWLSWRSRRWGSIQRGLGSGCRRWSEVHGGWLVNHIVFVHADNSFMCPKMLCLTSTASISLLFCYSTRYERCTIAKEPSWWEPGTCFLGPKMLKLSIRNMVSTCCIDLNLNLLIDMDCRRQKRAEETNIQLRWSPNILPLPM